MTATTHKRNLFDAVIFEPAELIISQPHQALISGASVFLVAAEAGILIDWPYNVLLAIGAEWAYLKGLSSGQTVKTGWAVALNWSAVALVVLYGSLWGMRRFGVPLPSEGYRAVGFWPIAGAVLLTLVHILCIGAVTICSAMVHAAALAEQREQREGEQAKTRAREQAKQDRLDAIEAAKLQADADLAIEWQRRRADLALREAEQASKMQMQDARSKMRRHALPARANADAQICPKCGAALSRPQYLAARRWGHCAGCKE